MKEFLRQLKNEDFDGINFYRNKEGNTEVSQFVYKRRGKKRGGTNLGDYYDIILVHDDPPKMPDRFRAILISPLDYISRMLECGFVGVVAKVTTTSDKIMDEIFEALSHETKRYIKYNEENGNERQ